MIYQLKKDGIVIVERPYREQIVIEAIERGWVDDWGADFPGDKPGRALSEGVEITTTTTTTEEPPQ